MNGIIAARPWSWTAAAVPIILTGVLLSKQTGEAFLSAGFLTALAIGILVQVAANLKNSYQDFKHEVDKKETAGDRAIVDNLITPKSARIVAYICYAISTALAAPYLWEHGLQIKWVFISGMLLAFFYTATAFSLKYICLGDLAIFLAFGPLLMQFTAILITGQIQLSLMPYTIPIGLLTEAILHANNTRDIKSDAKAQISTLASAVGFDISCKLYILMIVGSYIASIVMTFTHDWGCILTILSIPLAYQNIMDLKPEKMKNMDERTAQMHLLYGVLMIGGVSLSSLFR